MALVDVINNNGEKVKDIDLPESIFNVEVKKEILHQVVRMQLARRRSANAHVKNRSDVKGSTRKLFRQKGTGRARRGDIKSPLLRGGGVVFGPKSQNFTIKVPKKVRRLALKMALSSKFQADELCIMDDFGLERIKTKDVQNILNNLELTNALIVTNGKDEKLELSSRNIPGVKVLRQEGLNVYDILKYDHLVLLENALEKIEGRFTDA